MNSSGIHPTPSPDGHKIAFIDSRDTRLGVADLATGRLKFVTGRDVGDVASFAWSPDSSKVLVSAQLDSPCIRLWMVDLKRDRRAISRCGQG